MKIIMEKTDYSTLVIVKICVMFVIGVGSFLIGVSPMFIGRCGLRKREKCCDVVSLSCKSSIEKSCSIDDEKTRSKGLLTSLLLCFGGGVLLFTTFLHLAPEVRQSVELHLSNGRLTSLGTLSITELLFCIGFFLVYLIEETVEATLTSSDKLEASKDFLSRSVSLRRCNKERVSSSVSTTTISTVTARTMSNETSTNNRRVERFEYVEDEEARIENKALALSRNSIESTNEAKKEIAPCKTEEKKCYSLRKFGKRIEPIEGEILSTPATRKMELDANCSIHGLVTVIALSFHAIFEGLAVGLEASTNSVIYLAAAITTHKFVIGFCVGTELYVADASSRIIISYLSAFSLVTPLGIGVGIILGHYNNETESLGPTPTILQGIAVGTLLYVVFFEILGRERANEKSGLLQLAAIIVGFLFMLGLQLATSHSHTHSHNGHHEDKSQQDEDHDHSVDTKVQPINDAIDTLTRSVAEAVSEAIASSTTLQPTNLT